MIVLVIVGGPEAMVHVGPTCDTAIALPYSNTSPPLNTIQYNIII